MRPLTLHSVCRNNQEPFRPVELLNPCAGDFSGTLQREKAELERCGHCRRDYVYGALALRLARRQTKAAASPSGIEKRPDGAYLFCVQHPLAGHFRE